MTNIKVGDLVEDCSLMPGVVMNIDGDDIEIRRLDINEYKNQVYSSCSLSSCGIVKITPLQVIKRLVIGKDKLAEIWRTSNSLEEYYFRIDSV